MGFDIAATAVQHDVLGHGCVGVQTDDRVACIDCLAFGKIHQLAPETQALGIRGDSQVIQQQGVVCLYQDDKTLHAPGVVQHVNPAGLDQLAIVLQHRAGFAPDPFDIRRVGSLDDSLDGCNILNSGGAHHCSVLLGGWKP